MAEEPERNPLALSEDEEMEQVITKEEVLDDEQLPGSDEEGANEPPLARESTSSGAEDSLPNYKKIPCMVASCRNSIRVEKNASFHKWPKNDDETKSLWIAACGRQNVQILDNQGVCGLHFDETAFETNLKEELMGVKVKKTLKKGAVPTLNLRANVEDFVIRKMERVVIEGTTGETLPTNKMTVEVGPAYEHHLKTIAEPQIITITVNRVVARPPLNKRSKNPRMLKSEYICRVRHCPFQDEKAFMFCFPESESLRDAWSNACILSKSAENNDRNCWVPRVCSYHFKKEDFEMTSKATAGFRDLNDDAVPSLHITQDDNSFKRAKLTLKRLEDQGHDVAAMTMPPPPEETERLRPKRRPRMSREDLYQDYDLGDDVVVSARSLLDGMRSRRNVAAGDDDDDETEEREIVRILERKALINNLLKEAEKREPARKKAKRNYVPEPIYEPDEQSESAFDRMNRPIRNVGVQVDFPDACNLLVYQCMKQLKNALTAKDEELAHLRALVTHLGTELQSRKNTMVVATPVVFDDDFEASKLKDVQKVWFCDKPEEPAAPPPHVIQNVVIAEENVDGGTTKRSRSKKSYSACLEPSSNPEFVRTMCCVPGCPSPVTVAYHKFPVSNKVLMKEWIQRCFGDAAGDRDFSHATVCGRHFSEASFDIVVEMEEDTTQTKTKTVLKEDAVPTENLNKFADV